MTFDILKSIISLKNFNISREFETNSNMYFFDIEYNKLIEMTRYVNQKEKKNTVKAEVNSETNQNSVPSLSQTTL